MLPLHDLQIHRDDGVYARDMGEDEGFKATELTGNVLPSITLSLILLYLSSPYLTL